MIGNILRDYIDCLFDHPQLSLLKLFLVFVKDFLVNLFVPYAKGIMGYSHYLMDPKLNPQQVVSAYIKRVFDKVNVYVVNDFTICNNIICQRMASTKFIGLDCEWISSKKESVALVQIFSGSDCILYQITSNNVFPSELKKLLEDRNILKFGVAIQEDARRLKSYNVNVSSHVDLRFVADRCLFFQQKACTEDRNFPGKGLRSLAFKTLQFNLPKDIKVQCSNWEANPLTEEQIKYAAKDAYVSLLIFYSMALNRKFKLCNSVALLKDAFKKTNIESKVMTSHIYVYDAQSDELGFDDILLDAVVTPSSWFVEVCSSLCQGITEKKYKNKRQNAKTLKAKSSATSNKKAYKHAGRDKPLYENCFLLAPNGILLATVNQTKARWYITKKLGVVDRDDPLTVRLLFEPAGVPHADGDYYTTIKQNVCVVCGREDGFVRKMIVPHEYRKYFPKHLKGHSSHDVLLFCLDCHRHSQSADEALRQHLAHQYNAPMGTVHRLMFINDPHSTKVKYAAKALKFNSDKIPRARQLELQSVISEYLGVDDVDEQVLTKVIEMNVKVKNKNFRGTHGDVVVKRVIEDQILDEFVRMWRKHFLDTMQPRFLPELWWFK